MAKWWDVVEDSTSENDPWYGWNLSGFDTGSSDSLQYDEKKAILSKVMALGRPLTEDELIAMDLFDTKSKNNKDHNEFKQVVAWQKAAIDANASKIGFNYEGQKVDENGTIVPLSKEEEDDSDEIDGVPRDVALDKYFNEWYSGKEGTTGVKIRGELENIFANQANTEMMLADAAFQQQALQQAQTVKSITDQVRAERMARLKAGMSESQIANQDMQMMMANVNALNDQASMMNQGRLQAQANAMNAKDQAYLAYLEQAAGGAQTGAAYSAANAGDLSYQVRNSLYRKYGANWTPEQERQETLLLSGQAGIR